MEGTPTLFVSNKPSNSDDTFTLNILSELLNDLLFCVHDNEATPKLLENLKKIEISSLPKLEKSIKNFFLRT